MTVKELSTYVPTFRPSYKKNNTIKLVLEFPIATNKISQYWQFCTLASQEEDLLQEHK